MKKKPIDRIPNHVDALLPDDGELVQFKPINSPAHLYGTFHKKESDKIIGQFVDERGRVYDVLSERVKFLSSDVHIWWRLLDKKVVKAAKKAMKPKKEKIKTLDTPHYMKEVNKVSDFIDSKLVGWTGLCAFMLSFLVSCNPPQQAITVVPTNVVTLDTIAYGDDRFHEDEDLEVIVYGYTSGGDTVVVEKWPRKRWKGLERKPER